MIKVFHLVSLTEEERKRLNSPTGGWDSEPLFTRHADITMSGKVSAVQEAISLGDYFPVADVDTNEMEDAFRLTNHIETDWTKNEDVNALMPSARSTSVGDLMQLEDGRVFLVSNLGFTYLHTVKVAA